MSTAASDLIKRVRGATAAVATDTIRNRMGRLIDVRGMVAQAYFQGATKGMICELDRPGRAPLTAEIVALEGNRVTLTPYGSTEGLRPGGTVRLSEAELSIMVGPQLLGRVVDPFGRPLDGRPVETEGATRQAIHAPPPEAMARPIIAHRFLTGCRAMDSCLTLGRGQRLGIFGPPGTGKSSLLEMLVSNCDADVIVVALIGERGREVGEFFQAVAKHGKEGRLVIVAATSDQPANSRALCAHTANAVAEHFRDQGKSVLLLVDSLTRVARALREIGLAAGEPPTRRGYPASVYPALPAIIERAGRGEKGDITALYTVLTEGDPETDPIGEEVKSLTDGHVLLSRDLANAGHYPAIDVLGSLSRSMPRIVEARHQEMATHMRRLLAKYNEIELLLKVDEYRPGTDPVADEAVAKYEAIGTFLRQGMTEQTDFAAMLRALEEVLA